MTQPLDCVLNPNPYQPQCLCYGVHKMGISSYPTRENWLSLRICSHFSGSRLAGKELRKRSGMQYFTHPWLYWESMRNGKRMSVRFLFHHGDTGQLTHLGLVKQIGFSRLISDGSRFTWLADFFILPSHRRIGLGKALLEVLLASQWFQARRQVVNIQSSKELQKLLHDYGGFDLIKDLDTNFPTVMYKQVQNQWKGQDDATPPPNSSIENVYHPVLKDYFISTSPGVVQLPAVHKFLKTSYWCPGIELETVQRELMGSDCISLFYQKEGDVNCTSKSTL